MDSSPSSAVDWARRVNSSWLVRGGLNESAAAWLERLGKLGDGRLMPSCEAARAMCGKRGPLEDPKPWFYAGLFSMVTAAEAKGFLDTHRITKAAVPAMRGNEDVLLWLDRTGPEARALVARLRDALDGPHR